VGRDTGPACAVMCVSRVAAETQTIGSWFVPQWDTVVFDDGNAWEMSTGHYPNLIIPAGYSLARFTVYSNIQANGQFSVYIQIDGPTVNKARIRKSSFHAGSAFCTEWIAVNCGEQWGVQILVAGGAGSFAWAGNGLTNAPYFQAELMRG
jgi:hypothetical protein